jgi:hypothetical protein
MKAVVNAHELKTALARLKPRAKYRSMRESHVTATAGGGSLVLLGTLDNSASLAAVVDTPGQGIIPLDSAIRVLSTYDKKSSVVIQASAGELWIDQLRFAVPKGL